MTVGLSGPTEHAHQNLPEQDTHARRRAPPQHQQQQQQQQQPKQQEGSDGDRRHALMPCCGLDVQKRSVVACLLVPGPEGTPTKEFRTFGTMTHDLVALSDWLRAAACTHVALESPGVGVFGKPIYNLLEGQFELLVVHAAHINAVPGRTTDVRAAAAWIADLLRHGLLPPSFLPARPQRELREVTRSRTTLLNERAPEVTRLQQGLDGANRKLASVATAIDLLGKSGHDILAALGGEQRCRGASAVGTGAAAGEAPQREQALAGQFSAPQRFVLARAAGPYRLP